MKVLVFSRIFPSPQAPGRGIYNFHRFKALAEFCDVRVIAPVPVWTRGARFSRGYETTDYQGVSVAYPAYWALPRIAPQLHARTLYLAARSHIRRLRDTFAFDAILGAFAYPDLVAAAHLARDNHCPLVGLVMGSDINALARKHKLREQIGSALAQADSVIALSAGLKERVVELGVPERRVVVQNNSVDGTRFDIRDQAASRRQLGLERRHVVCFIGNLVQEKGPDVLIEALPHIDPSILASLKVVFVGDGHLKDALRSRARQLDMGNIVEFAGRRPPNEIPAWMSAADLLCLPSRREGCPNVVLEALASGRPVVASSVGGVPDLITDRNGIRVPPDDPAQLGRAIGQALQRSWVPAELRSSVASLTWSDMGRAVHQALDSAVRLHQNP